MTNELKAVERLRLALKEIGTTIDRVRGQGFILSVAMFRGEEPHVITGSIRGVKVKRFEVDGAGKVNCWLFVETDIPDILPMLEYDGKWKLCKAKYDTSPTTPPELASFELIHPVDADVVPAKSEDEAA